MTSTLRPALVLFVLLTALTGLVYPFALTDLAQLAFPIQAAGSLVVRDGKPIGSTLIGQNFSDPKYLWGRPSATGPQPYNASNSSGSNLGPLNPALTDAIKGRIAALRAADPDNSSAIPVDLVTTSGSGLDPHLSAAGAKYQAGRIAKARKLAVSQVEHLIDAQTEGALFGLLGEPRVNVLAINLALDAIHP
jgi:K+-transporting ATPase ATPase C chain